MQGLSLGGNTWNHSQVNNSNDVKVHQFEVEKPAVEEQTERKPMSQEHIAIASRVVALTIAAQSFATELEKATAPQASDTLLTEQPTKKKKDLGLIGRIRQKLSPRSGRSAEKASNKASNLGELNKAPATDNVEPTRRKNFFARLLHTGGSKARNAEQSQQNSNIEKSRRGLFSRSKKTKKSEAPAAIQANSPPLAVTAQQVRDNIDNFRKNVMDNKENVLPRLATEATAILQRVTSGEDKAQQALEDLFRSTQNMCVKSDNEVIFDGREFAANHRGQDRATSQSDLFKKMFECYGKLGDPDVKKLVNEIKTEHFENKTITQNEASKLGIEIFNKIGTQDGAGAKKLLDLIAFGRQALWRGGPQSFPASPNRSREPGVGVPVDVDFHKDGSIDFSYTLIWDQRAQSSDLDEKNAAINFKFGTFTCNGEIKFNKERNVEAYDFNLESTFDENKMEQAIQIINENKSPRDNVNLRNLQMIS